MSFGFLVQKWPFRDAHLLSKNKGPETPILIVFLGARFLDKVSKKEILESQQEKWKNLTDNWKANFWYFCCFLGGFVFSCFFFLCFFLFLCFLGGFKGQVRWPEGPPHLALNPPYFFLFFLLVFFGGFKGQARWPEGPPHSALNPPYLFLLFVFCFVFFVFF